MPGRVTRLLSREEAAVVSNRLRVFAHPQRIMIMASLLAGEMAVGQIDAATGIGQPSLSQQLAELRRAEVVRQRRTAKTVIYSIAEDWIADFVRVLVAGGGEDPAAGLVELLERRKPAKTQVSDGSSAVFAVVDRR